MPPRAVRAGSTTSPTPTSAITGCVMAPNLRPCTRSAQARTSGDRPDPTATTIATLPVWKPSGKPPLFARAKSTAARSQLSSHATSSWPESGMTKTNVCKRVAIQRQRKADVRATSCQGAPGAGTGRQPASSKPFRSASSVVPTTSAEGTSCAGTAMIAVSLVCGLAADSVSLVSLRGVVATHRSDEPTDEGDGDHGGTGTGGPLGGGRGNDTRGTAEGLRGRGLAPRPGTGCALAARRPDIGLPLALDGDPLAHVRLRHPALRPGGRRVAGQLAPCRGRLRACEQGWLAGGLPDRQRRDGGRRRVRPVARGARLGRARARSQVRGHHAPGDRGRRGR